ncbi:hypothetical protein GCM10027421_22040 [Microbacterium shaanxiense]
MTPSQGENGAAAEGDIAAALGATQAATQPKASPVSAGPEIARAQDGSAPLGTPVVTAATSNPLTAPPSARRTLAQRAIDRVPVKWLGTGLTVIFLATTAAFGGLAEVPKPKTPLLELGQTFVGAEVEMTPVSLTVVDELRGSGVFPEPGERVLSLVMDVRNLSEFARSSAVDDTLGGLRIEGLEDVKPSIARLDDDTGSPWLQPGIPVRVVASWPVPAPSYTDGARARLLLSTATRGVGQFVLYGVTWDDVRVGGHMDLAVEDLGTAEESE